MAEQTETKENVVLDQTPAPKIVMDSGALMTQLVTYRTNANASLAKLQETAEKLQNQLTEVQKMRLMISGQKQLVDDLINKMTGQVAEQPKEESK